MKFISGKLDFELPKAKLGNYFYGNLINTRNVIFPFTFDVFLQNENFYLDRLDFDKEKMTYTFTEVLQLDNSNKQTGYFSEISLTTPLDVGIYRLRAGSYYGASLIEIKDLTLTDINSLTDVYNDTFIDNTNDNLTE